MTSKKKILKEGNQEGSLWEGDVYILTETWEKNRGKTQNTHTQTHKRKKTKRDINEKNPWVRYNFKILVWMELCGWGYKGKQRLKVIKVRRPSLWWRRLLKTLKTQPKSSNNISNIATCQALRGLTHMYPWLGTNIYHCTFCPYRV